MAYYDRVELCLHFTDSKSDRFPWPLSKDNCKYLAVSKEYLDKKGYDRSWVRWHTDVVAQLRKVYGL